MRRVPALGGVLVALLVAQSTVLAGVRLGSARPDLVVLAVVAVAMASGPVPGATFGFWAGLASDLLTSLPVGISAFAYTVVGFTVGVVRFYVVSQRARVHLALIALGSMASTWLQGVALRLFDLSSWQLVARAGLLVAACNLLLAPAVYAPVKALVERLTPEQTQGW